MMEKVPNIIKKKLKSGRECAKSKFKENLHRIKSDDYI